MNFELTEEQKEIRKAAREFAEKEFDRELALKCDREEIFPWEIIRKAAKLGFIGVHYPEEYGGQGYGLLEATLVVEELCRVEYTLGAAIATSDFGCDMINLFGSEEQKKKYLPKVTSGESVSAAALTEPNHGSDITFVETTAKKEGNWWIINGTKTFITNGTIADFIIVLCQTNPNATPTYRGQSVFIVEPKGLEGFEALRIEGKMGSRLAPTAELSFNDVRIPLGALLGEEGRGFYQTLAMLNRTRILKSAARALGLAQCAIERAIKYAKERVVFGRKVADFQAIQHKIADVIIKIEAAKLLTYRAAYAVDTGKDERTLGFLSSIAKYYASHAALEAVNEALQIFGGYGYIAEYDVERYYREARLLTITEGTSEIQKNLIARTVLEI